jgi:hypothetical protein
MEIVPQMVDAVIDRLFETSPIRSPAPPSSGASQRESVRTPFHGRADAIIFPPPSTPHAEPIESEVVTTDISRGGLSILHRHELYPGQQVLLQLSQGSCTIEVCWCCQVWPGLYIAGCQFADVMLADSTS